MDLINNGNEDLTFDLLFNFPDNNINFDTIKKLNGDSGFIINKYGEELSSGNISITTSICNENYICNTLNGNYVKSNNLNDMWNNFINNNNNNKANNDTNIQYSFINRNISVKSNSTMVIEI